MNFRMCQYLVCFVFAFMTKALKLLELHKFVSVSLLCSYYPAWFEMIQRAS